MKASKGEPDRSKRATQADQPSQSVQTDLTDQSGPSDQSVQTDLTIRAGPLTSPNHLTDMYLLTKCAARHSLWNMPAMYTGR